MGRIGTQLLIVHGMTKTLSDIAWIIILVDDRFSAQFSQMNHKTSQGLRIGFYIEKSSSRSQKIGILQILDIVKKLPFVFAGDEFQTLGIQLDLVGESLRSLFYRTSL